MDIQGFIVPLIMGNPSIRSKIQGVTGQPVQHVAKCISNFMDALNEGPGLVDKSMAMQSRFQQVYSAGLRMGFSDWQSELCAADCAGYKLIDVATSFAQRRGWDCTIEELQQLHSTIMPRFLKRGKQVGLFQPGPEQSKDRGIPPISGQPKARGGQPPWRSKTQRRASHAQPSAMEEPTEA